MRRALIFLFLILFVLTAFAQPKTQGRVKRKYRDVERVSENLPQVIFRGLVRDINKIPVPGASVEIEGIKRLVHTNEFGQFMLSDLPTGRLRLKISCIGYRTKTIDYVLQQGYNDHYVALDKEMVHLEPVYTTVQKREQHIPDVPQSISVVTKTFADQLNITGFSTLGDYNSGFWYEELAAGKATFSMNGSNHSPAFPETAQSVGVFFDEVPVINSGTVSPLLFDMEKVEVVKGAHNALFGSNALAGAVNLTSRKPDNDFNGYITAGGGNIGSKEARAAVNLPLIDKMLFIRAAGLYSSADGFVENDAGGKLHARNNYAGRFSLGFLPVNNHKLDITFEISKNENSGTAFMNPWYKTGEYDAGIFDNRVYLNRGNELGSGQVQMNGTMKYRYFFNEHNYFTSISSFRQENVSDVWDADGTPLPALEMEDEQNRELFFQELRYNFSRKSRLNGSAGVSYRSERNNRHHSLSSNDELIYSILNAPGNPVMPSESRFPVHPQPLNPVPMGDFPLTGLHTEENVNERLTQSTQAFLHFTYRLNEVLFFTGGARGFYDRMQLNYSSRFTAGDESSLGQFSNSSPNLLFSPSDKQELSGNFLSVAAEAGITYRWNENFTLYIKAARARKPQTLLFAWDSRPIVLEAERVNSAEAGWNTTIKQRVYWNTTGFYRKHLNLQTFQWGEISETGLQTDNGKGISYGIETLVKAAIIKGFDLFGNYSWLKSAFDSTGIDGNEFIYSGNSFARAPEHSFSAGFTAKATVAKGMRLFATPWFTWKSHFWFTEANSPGTDQNAYGLLNGSAGIELDNSNLVLHIHGTNLLDQKYISSAGHWGGILGMPTVVQGNPRMLGATITWNF